MDLKSANVVSVFKKGERSIPSNYIQTSVPHLHMQPTIRTCRLAYILASEEIYDILCEE